MRAWSAWSLFFLMRLMHTRWAASTRLFPDWLDCKKYVPPRYPCWTLLGAARSLLLSFPISPAIPTFSSPTTTTFHATVQFSQFTTLRCVCVSQTSTTGYRRRVGREPKVRRCLFHPLPYVWCAAFCAKVTCSSPAGTGSRVPPLCPLLCCIAVETDGTLQLLVSSLATSSGTLPSPHTTSSLPS